MPYFLVDVRGDPTRAAGLLAKNGIQNIVHDAPRTLTARLAADRRERGVDVVLIREAGSDRIDISAADAELSGVASRRRASLAVTVAELSARHGGSPQPRDCHVGRLLAEWVGAWEVAALDARALAKAVEA